MLTQVHTSYDQHLTVRGVAHLVFHGTSGSTSYETIPPVLLKTSGGMLSIVDMAVQRRDSPRWLCDHDDGDDDQHHTSSITHALLLHAPVSPCTLCHSRNPPSTLTAIIPPPADGHESVNALCPLSTQSESLPGRKPEVHVRVCVSWVRL